MKKKKILFSFDYELFFGERSGTVQKTLIDPTNLLLDTLESVGAKGNFFIDYLMFERLEQLDDERAKSDLRKLQEQVKDMVRRGHRIELHLHPHWIDAKYNGDGTWDYADFTHYSLNSLSDQERSRMFKDGTKYLTNLAREIDPDYNICAFRAGGWAIQPFMLLMDSFKENGIIIDSSVMHGACQDNKYSKFDFKKSPDKEFYKFTDDVCNEDIKGDFIEVPIATYKRNIIIKIIERINKLFNTRPICITDGSHYRKDLSISQSRLQSWIEATPVPFSMSPKLPIIAKLVFNLSKKKIVTIIDHPKDYTSNGPIIMKYYMNKAKSITYIDLLVNKN